MIGKTGLIIDEPLLWEKGRKGRAGCSLPKRDVEHFPMNEHMTEQPLDIPDLSEPDVVRHYTRLSQWNFGIDTGMYPLGSCTMKYNPKLNDKLAGMMGFTGAHPLLPDDLIQGALSLMAVLEQCLAAITGLDAVSLQPAAGAQGELTGMLMIWSYHAKNSAKRSKIIVPDTAHGTNPASAALCGFTPVPVASDASGILAADSIARMMDTDTAGIMVTNPNTLGLFEENIVQISEIVHAKGGLVYCDGANMNAILNIVDLAKTGVDILHLNTHKTFSTPHGGGGPGGGPVCVKKHLEPFLPRPRVVRQKERWALSDDFPDAVGRFHAFYGNFGVMARAYSYLRTMGAENLRKVSQLAVLNANYIRKRLKHTYHLPYDRPCMHECVFSDKHQLHHKVTTLDIAKRLIDYGFHPPTIYFPLVVKGALMIEPTETESKQDLDLLIDALIAIAREAEEDPELLKKAPRKSKVGRLDETLAARKPCLCGSG